MAQPTQTDHSADPKADTCDRCGKNVAHNQVFVFKARSSSGESSDTGPTTEMNKCFSCALRHRPMLKRSLLAAAVVGTILTALNQGDHIFFGQWTGALYWKIPLTYCVPFLVATYGALSSNKK